jgi:beta-lactamase class A
MKLYREGTRVTLKQLLHLMITVSDNTATHMLGQWIGTDAVNAWLERHGFKTTRLLVPWPFEGDADKDFVARKERWASFREWGMGVTTPNEMVRLMEMIADGRAGTPAACDEMHRILNHQYFDDGIAGQVPPWVTVGSKSGIQKHSRSDVAIVHSPSGDYILAVYTREGRDTSTHRDNEQDSAIRAVSRAVWRHYHPDIKWSPPPGSEKYSTGPDW